MAEQRCGCGRAVHAKGLCGRCYQAKRRAEYPEVAYRGTKRWRERHPGARRGEGVRRYERNREQIIAASTAWNRDNDERRREIVATSHRKHGQRDRSYDVAAQEYAAILFGDPCSYCGGLCEVIDHVDAVAKGGGTGWDNLTAACNDCNARKHATPLLFWVIRKLG